MNEIDARLTNAVREKGFVGLTVQTSYDARRQMSLFETFDMLGHLLDVYQVYGLWCVHDQGDIDFVAHKIYSRLQAQFCQKEYNYGI